MTFNRHTASLDCRTEINMSDESKDTCPLEASWQHRFCLTYADDETNDTFHLCQDHAQCVSNQKVCNLNQSQLEARLQCLKAI